MSVPVRLRVGKQMVLAAMEKRRDGMWECRADGWPEHVAVDWDVERAQRKLAKTLEDEVVRIARGS